MSELRAGTSIPREDDPDALVRRIASASGPSNGQIVPFPAVNRPTAPNASRDQTVAWWVQNAGVPVHVAQGIADNIQRESGFQPDLVAPDRGGPSAGLYQAHLDRMANLQQNPNWSNPNVQHAWALGQVTGGDAIATQHWNEIRNAKTREEANQLWKQYFERPAGSPGHQQETAQTSAHAELQRIGGQSQQLIDQLLKEGGRSRDTWKRLGEAQDKMREYQERALRAAEHPPSATPRDSLEKLGGLATLVGILGGMLTHQPLTASLNAGAAAMEAYNTNDQETYKRQVDQWKYHTDTLMKMAQFEHEQYRDILADEKGEASERMNRLHAVASLLGNERMAAIAQIGDERAVRNHAESMAQARQHLELQNRQFEETARHHQAMEAKGSLPGGTAEFPIPEKWEGMPDKPPPGSPYSQSIWTAALSYAQTGKMPAIGMSSGPRTQILEATPAALQALGMKPSDAPVAQAEYHGLLAAESTLGRRLANLTTSIEETAKAAPPVIEASKNVRRTEFPSLNAFANWLRAETGDTAIVDFRAKLNTFLNLYAKGVNPTGQMTDQQQRHAYETLRDAMSQGQIEIGIKALTQELGYMKSGLGEAAGELPGMFPHTATGQRSKEAKKEAEVGEPRKTLEVTEQEYEKLQPGAAYQVPGSATVYYKQ